MKEIYKGRVVNLNIEEVNLPNGNKIDLEIIRHSGASAIVPIKENGDVVLIRQFRYAAGGFIYEIPAGRLDKGEDPKLCALRELEEETGYRAGHIEPLNMIFTTPGFTDEKIYLFIATELTQIKQNLEFDEVIEIVYLPLAKALDMIDKGEIQDGKTIAGLFMAFMRGRK